MTQVLLQCGYHINVENGLVSSFINETNQRFSIVLKSGNSLPFVLKLLLHIFHMPTDITDLFNSLYHYKKNYLKLFPEDSINGGMGFLTQNFEIVDSFLESAEVLRKIQTLPEIMHKLPIYGEPITEETFDMEPTVKRRYINELIHLREHINTYTARKYDFETFSSEIFIIYFAYLCEGKPFPMTDEYNFNYFKGNSIISSKLDYIISEFYSFVPSEKQREKFLPAIFLQLFFISCTDINRFFPSFLKKVYVYRSFIKYNDPRFFCTNKFWRFQDLLSNEKSSISFRKYLLRKEITRNYILSKIEFVMKLKEFHPTREDFLSSIMFQEYNTTKNIIFKDETIGKLQTNIKDLIRKEESIIKQYIDKMCKRNGGWEAASCAYEISKCNLKYFERLSYYCTNDNVIKSIMYNINANCLLGSSSGITSMFVDGQFIPYDRIALELIKLPNGSHFGGMYVGSPKDLYQYINELKFRFEELMYIPLPIVLPKEIVRLHDCPVCLAPCELIKVTCHPNHGICLDCFYRSSKLTRGSYICVLCRRLSGMESK